MKELSLREIQLGMLEILKKLHEICQQQGLTYYLAWGTLLGAVRHQGFIPWDDDLDVSMPRPDYDRLVDYLCAHQEQLGPFRLMHERTNPRYIYPIARLCDTRYQVDYADTQDYGLGLFVDIYPLDGGGCTPESYRHQFRRHQTDMALAFQAGTRHFRRSEQALWRTPIKFCLYAYAKLRGAQFFARKLNAEASAISYADSSMVGILVWDSQPEPFPKQWFEKTVLLPFEGSQFPVPQGYDAILRQMYGDYWELPPEQDRIGHHFYTAYRKD